MSLLDFLRDFGFLILLLAVIGFLLLWAELKGGDVERRTTGTELPGPGSERATSAMPERTPPPSAPRPPARSAAAAPAQPQSGSGPIRRPPTDPRRGQ